MRATIPFWSRPITEITPRFSMVSTDPFGKSPDRSSCLGNMVTTRARMLVLLALSAGAVALVAVFGADLWGLARFDGEALGRRVEALGPLAPAALFVLMVVQCVIAPIPSEPLMAAAGYLYGARLGALLSWAGIDRKSTRLNSSH